MYTGMTLAMQSSPIEYLSPQKIERLKELFNSENVRILTQDKGGNSKVFCVEVDGEKWAVKSYPPYAPNQRDRLAAECLAYQFLNSHGITAVPTFKAVCPIERWLIINWIDGVIPTTYSNSDIDQAIAFLQQIANLNSLPEAQSLPHAAEACVSLDIIIKQIEQRFQRLQILPENDPALLDFLLYSFLPTFEQLQRYAIAGFQKHHINPSLELDFSKRSLIPADFGFHNSLRDQHGKLFFFDFDYFGWDDPVKLLADILWHPKLTLTTEQKEQFITGISKIYQADSLFLPRFHYTLPLFGLRWVLILLNEFIPAFWQNRQHADVHLHQGEAKKTQLKRAKDLLRTVQQIGCDHEPTHTTVV